MPLEGRDRKLNPRRGHSYYHLLKLWPPCGVKEWIVPREQAEETGWDGAAVGPRKALYNTSPYLQTLAYVIPWRSGFIAGNPYLALHPELHLC